MSRFNSRFFEEERGQTKIDSSLAMVNIVLLLIFFFISSGSILASREVTVELPETTNLSLDTLPSPLLEIQSDGGMILDGVEIPVGALATATLDTPVLHVLADRDTNAIRVFEVLEAENLVAVELRLVTLHQAGEAGS
ncbi:hypothetical protein GFB49_19415 [Epibacterium sp. SM1979]|uniref:Biopolymer transport protein ExbD/TolR n=1 Tax=Tritonibacter litoralis TaxID=2662264 RepID=A0A843YLE5_9RHOB|nr:hypothetical protein [Tritonibacter litoralis]MQQ10628.1 hypothetical protein [Tritonibacter litoralis]